MYARNKMSWWLYVLGVLVVVGTHLYMVLYGMPAEMVSAHAMLNLVASMMLITGWLTRKA